MVKKHYKKIALVVAIIIGILAGGGLLFFSPTARASFRGDVNWENYQILIQYAREVANNFDVDLGDEIEVSKALTKDALIVNVDKDLYGIEATFPISTYQVTVEDGIIKYEGVFTGGSKFRTHTEVDEPGFYIVMSTSFGSLVALGIYASIKALLSPKEEKD